MRRRFAQYRQTGAYRDGQAVLGFVIIALLFALPILNQNRMVLGVDAFPLTSVLRCGDATENGPIQLLCVVVWL